MKEGFLLRGNVLHCGTNQTGIYSVVPRDFLLASNGRLTYLFLSLRAKLFYRLNSKLSHYMINDICNKSDAQLSLWCFYINKFNVESYKL